MANPQPGAQVAKELGIYLGQIYSYIKAGKVVNHKVGGYPDGKGVEVDVDEVRNTMSDSRRRRKSDDSGEPRQPRTRTDGAPRRVKRSRDVDRPTYRHAQLTPMCPVDPDHGFMLPNDDERARKSGKVWMCTHQGHDGRPRATGVPTPATQFIFTDEEARMPQPLGVLGRVMLEWIGSGHLDLASGLEKWMERRELIGPSGEVWIPDR